ncbi:MAG: flagellar hook-basal body complex protein, partial [Oscillospiraceae bacterium]
DVIGNNIANVNTNGFKAGRVTFKDSFYQTMSGSTSASGQMGGSNAKQVGYGSQVGAIDVIHTGGGFAPTGEASDLMISGNGFFCVGPYDKAGLDPLDKNSVPKLSLTRLGIFRFDGTGKLSDPNGNVVYGFKGISTGVDTATLVPGKEYTTTGGTAVKMTAAGAPPTFEMQLDDKTWTAVTATTKPSVNDLTVEDKTVTPAVWKLKTGLIDKARLVPVELPFDTVKNSPLKMESITFGKNGTITGIDEYGNNVTIGQVAVANVPNPGALEMTDSSYYKAKNNTGDVIAATPGSGGTGTIESGGLEMSNVDLSKEFSDMITTQRGFQANTKIITVTDEMLQELVNIKR